MMMCYKCCLIAEIVLFKLVMRLCIYRIVTVCWDTKHWKASSVDTGQVCTKENHLYTFNHNVSALSTPTFCLAVRRLGVSIVEDQIHCSHTHCGSKDDRNAISAGLRLLKVKSPKEQFFSYILWDVAHCAIWNMGEGLQAYHYDKMSCRSAVCISGKQCWLPFPLLLHLACLYNSLKKLSRRGERSFSLSTKLQ